MKHRLAKPNVEKSEYKPQTFTDRKPKSLAIEILELMSEILLILSWPINLTHSSHKFWRRSEASSYAREFYDFLGYCAKKNPKEKAASPVKARSTL